MNTQAGAGTSLFTNALIWFGAAVSIAEIEVGTQLASSAAGGRLGMVLSAILIGHLLGGFLLCLVSRIGGALRRSGMDCAKVPFGRAGGGFFAGANLLQLVGWTAVMIASGAAAAQPLVPESVPFGALCAGLGWLFFRAGRGEALAPLRALGRASFEIFLFNAWVELLGKRFGLAQGPVSWLLWSLGSVMTGLAYHAVVERCMKRAARGV